MEEEPKNKALLYIFLVLLLAIGGSFLYWYFLQGPVTPGPGNGSTDGLTSSSGTRRGTSGSTSTGTTGVPNPIPAGEVLYIKALTGESVPVRDFTKNPIATTETGVVIVDSSDYILMHYVPDQSFLITIINEDVEYARQKAESDLLSILGISKAQACILRVSLTIPRAVSETLSGQDYHLSFCPDGKPFFRF